MPSKIIIQYTKTNRTFVVLFLLIRIHRRPPILFRRHCCCNCNVALFRLDGFQFQVLLLYQWLLFRWLLRVLQLLLMAPPHYHRSIPPELPTRIHGYCYWCNTASRRRRYVCSNPLEVHWRPACGVMSGHSMVFSQWTQR
jgi:hypothetical protein